MVISVQEGSHVRYPDHCPFHAEKANGLEICGHGKYEGTNKDLLCGYINTPSDHLEPPSHCPLYNTPVEGVKIEAMQ